MTLCWRCGKLILPTDSTVRTPMCNDDGPRLEEEGNLPYWHRRCYLDVIAMGVDDMNCYGSSHLEDFN